MKDKMKLRVSVAKNRKRGKHKKLRTKWWHHLREYLWPTIGWHGLLRWAEIAIKRAGGSAHSVALGVAFGVFISFTPTISLQVLIMALFCWLTGANFVAAVVASLVGNPWTFPFIWLWVYELGHFVLGTPPQKLPEDLSFFAVMGNFEFYWKEYLWPMTVGGIPSGLVAGLLSYWAVLFEVASYRKARAAFLARRRATVKRKGVLNKIVEKMPIIKSNNDD